MEMIDVETERDVSGRDPEEGLAALRSSDGGQCGEVHHREHPSHLALRPEQRNNKFTI